ncbi:MAG: hypothetical protein ACQKBV_01405 [Puniceicoccales bacterium]
MTLPLPRWSLIVFILAGISLGAHARIGEDRSTLERRLTEAAAVEVTDNEIIAQHLEDAPFNGLLPTDDREIQTSVYYKKADGSRAYSSNLVDDRDRPVRAPDGWIVVVVYYKGRSVLEFYKRSGGLTEPEAHGILLLNRGGANWVKEKLPKDNYPSDDYKPLLSHTLHRSDYQVLANNGRGGLTLYSVGFDQHLSDTKREREQESAPESLAGF